MVLLDTSSSTRPAAAKVLATADNEAESMGAPASCASRTVIRASSGPSKRNCVLTILACCVAEVAIFAEQGALTNACLQKFGILLLQIDA